MYAAREVIRHAGVQHAGATRQDVDPISAHHPLGSWSFVFDRHHFSRRWRISTPTAFLSSPFYISLPPLFSRKRGPSLRARPARSAQDDKQRGARIRKKGERGEKSKKQVLRPSGAQDEVYRCGSSLLRRERFRARRHTKTRAMPASMTTAVQLATRTVGCTPSARPVFRTMSASRASVGPILPYSTLATPNTLDSRYTLTAMAR